MWKTNREKEQFSLCAAGKARKTCTELAGKSSTFRYRLPDSSQPTTAKKGHN
jgi:hypothetical protein